MAFLQPIVGVFEPIFPRIFLAVELFFCFKGNFDGFTLNFPGGFCELLGINSKGAHEGEDCFVKVLFLV